MRPLRILGLAAVAAAVAAGTLALFVVTPDPHRLLDAQPGAAVEVADRSGELLRFQPDQEGLRWLPVEPGAIAPRLEHAVLAAEDRRFYQHPGVDPAAVLRAAWQNLGAGRIVSGGSTLTMQLARILEEARPRGLRAKASQTLLALRLELALSKRRVLAEYLSRCPMGNRIVGYEAASRAYLGKPSSQLSPAEAALLASIPRSPSRVNPWRNERVLVKRRDEVLRRMRNLGLLDEASFSAALAEPVVLAREPFRARAPHFLRRALEEAAPAARGGARLVTTLDLPLQGRVETLARRHLEELAGHGVRQMAVVVLDVERGEWIALEGSGLDGDLPGRWIDGARVPRQPGSALKPFTYAAAFDRGFTPATILPDLPNAYAWETGTWVPRNYDERYHGPLRAREALACSINVPAAVVLERLGPGTLLGTLRRAGITSLTGDADTYGLGLTLGAGEVRLDELTLAYAALVRGGEWRPATTWRAVADAKGRILERAARGAPVRVCSRAAAAQVIDVLSDPEARARAFGSLSVLRLPFAAAVKTGTSEGFRDNWCIGGTREVVVGVWCGNFDRAPMGNVSGVSGAGALWREVMLAWAELRHRGEDLAARRTLGDPPPEMTRAEVCALSGLTPSRDCPVAISELFRAADVPREVCGWHVRAEDGRASIVWPPLYRDWAAKQEDGVLEVHSPWAELQESPSPLEAAPVLQRDETLSMLSAEQGSQAQGAELPSKAVGAREDGARSPIPRDPSGARSAAVREIDPTGGAPIAVVSPAGGDSFVLSPDLPLRYQSLELRCTVRGAPAEVSWLVDGRPFATAAAPYSVSWPLAAGTHTFQAAAGSLRSRPVVVTVHGPHPVRLADRSPPSKAGPDASRTNAPPATP